MQCPILNQHDYGNQSYYENSFCAACSMVAASNCVGSTVTMQRAINDGVVNATDGFVNQWDRYAIIPPGSSPYSKEESMEKIYQYINNNDYPVIVSVTTSSGRGHFAVAFSAFSTTEAGIYIMDPWIGSSTTLEEFLTRYPIWRGMRYVSPKPNL